MPKEPNKENNKPAKQQPHTNKQDRQSERLASSQRQHLKEG
jgi:hypothetical protein